MITKSTRLARRATKRKSTVWHLSRNILRYRTETGKWPHANLVRKAATEIRRQET